MHDKAQLPSLPAHFDGSVSADFMFDEVLKKVRAAYGRCPAYSTQSTDTRPIFDRFVSCIMYSSESVLI